MICVLTEVTVVIVVTVVTVVIVVIVVIVVCTYHLTLRLVFYVSNMVRLYLMLAL